MQGQKRSNNLILSNFLWFLACFALAFFVWVIATNAADPIIERRLSQQFNIVVDLDPGYIIVEQSSRTTRVNIRAQESVINLLTADDITVHADLTGLGAGTHTVTLKPEIARRVIDTDTQPLQITVTVEEVRTQQVPVVSKVVQEPPTGFQRSSPAFSETQVVASGASSKVQQVVAAQASLDLSEQRTGLEIEARLLPVDAEGNVIGEVTLEPQTVTVSVDVALLEGVAEVPVTPRIDTDSLPDGYDLISFTSIPQTVFVTGNLIRIPDVLETESISLQEHTEDFEITVPIELPSGRLFILGEQQTVTVSFRITPRIITRQFEDIPVMTFGLASDLDDQIVTTQVTLLVTGPQATLENLEAENLRAMIDLTGLTPGTYNREPVAYYQQTVLEADNISLSPSTIDVTIVQSGTPAVTPTATP